MATQFSSQGTKRPAPRWWRTTERIIVLAFIPAATMVIQSWGFEDEKLTLRLNLLIVVVLGALVKGIGMALIDTDDNYVSNLSDRDQEKVDINPIATPLPTDPKP